MVLSQADLDLIESFQDTTKREAMRKRMTDLDKEATENGLRQTEFSKKMNELGQKQKDIDSRHQKNLEWYNKAKTQWDDINKDNREAKERLAALESAQGAAGSNFGTSDDPDELQKQIRAARADVDATKKSLAEVTTTVNEFQTMIKEGKLITIEEVNKRGDALGAAVLDIVDFQAQAKADFGLSIPRAQLLEETNKHGGDIAAAYEVLTKEASTKKMRETIVAEERARLITEQKASNVPYASGGEPVMGPLQARLQGKKEGSIPDEIPADGSGRLAALIGNELRAEGKT